MTNDKRAKLLKRAEIPVLRAALNIMSVRDSIIEENEGRDDARSEVCEKVCDLTQRASKLLQDIGELISELND